MVEPKLKLGVSIESQRELDWLKILSLGEVDAEAVVFMPRDSRFSPPGATRAIAHETHIGTPSWELPSFAEIVKGLELERPDGCLLLSDGILARLMTLAADTLGVPVFILIENPEQLANISRRSKVRPDLFFLADSRLFPVALFDSRYGSTLLPTGHPGRDLVVRDGVTADPAFSAASLGDGRAGLRIRSAIERWRTKDLDPEQPDLSIIVPAYREAQNLPLVCDRLLAALEADPVHAEILLVDDSSPDETYAVAVEQMWRSPRIRAFTKSTPRGIGSGIRYGLRQSRAPIVAITMGDGSDEVSKIPEMFRSVRNDGFALAIGSRYRHRQNYEAVPLLYRFWSWCFRIVTGTLIGLRLQDYTNAFRVFDRRIFSRYGPESDGFEISPEITFKAWYATRRVTEVDVRHLKRSSGQSSFSFLRAGPGYARILLKAFVNRLTGRWFTLEW
jgi:dolichol-phosphate mannosyltransferase